MKPTNRLQCAWAKLAVAGIGLTTLSAQGQTSWTNSASITIPDVGAGTPYPSTINVSGLTGVVSKATVTLVNVSHTWPHDIGVLLVGPTGANTLLMADAGGGNSISNVTLNFDGAATSSLPTSQIVAGTFKPTSYNSSDPFPTGAPPGPYTASLSVFNTLTPNGTWSLYVMDDAASDHGSVGGGWILTLYTAPNQPPTVTPIADQTVNMNTSTSPLSFTIGDDTTPASSLTLAGSSSNPTVVPASGIVFGGSGSNRTVTMTPAVNQTGVATITVTVTDGFGLSTNTSFGLTVQAPSGTATFANTAGITIPSIGQGTPYPSTISVSGITGVVTKVTVQLLGLSHSWPHDVGVLVVGPTGQKVMLMSDAGGGNRISNVNLNFDDTANNPLPNNATIVSGNYTPTAYDPNDPFSAPAPAGPYPTSLSSFYNLNANGTWSLYVLDDAVQDQGSIAGGWSVTVTSGADQPPSITSIPDQATSVNTATPAASFTIGDAETAATSLALTGTSSNPALLPATNIFFGGSASNRTVVLVPAPNQTGAATVTVTVSDPVGSNSTAFNLTVTNANTPTAISSAWWSNQLDSNHNGCYESATLNWLPVATDGGTYSVYEIAYFRTNLTSWVSFFTNAVHSITASNSSNTQLVNIGIDTNKGNCTPYDYKIEIYRGGQSTPDYIRSADYDPVLQGHPEEGVPDIIVWVPAIQPYFTTTYFPPGDCAINHGCTLQGTRRLLRFTTQARNIGNTDLYMGAPGNNPLFVWDPCHGHWHFNDYASYRLLSGSSQIAAGNKLGFCIEDVGPWSPSAPASGKYNCNNQGIQAGWYDLYNGDTTCQWIDITGIPPGSYTLEIHLNPYGYILEANTNNNIGTAPVTITNTPPVLSTIADQSTPRNTATAPIPFYVWDAETPWNSLTITASSSNPTLVPNTNIVVGGSDTNRTITITPVANQVGTATIGISVSDGNGGVATNSFNLSVLPASLVSIDVTPAALSLSVGQTVQYSASGHFSDGTTQDLTASVVWQSSSTPVATINVTGLATLMGVGTTQITATQAGIVGTASLSGAAGNGATTFFNSGYITINPIGVASPYPSTISVFGLSGAMSKVTASISQYSHTWPHDVGILLVSPTGQQTLLMADAGAGNALTNVNLTFDDAATASLPNGQIVSGTYKPTSYNSNDPFQPPCPAGPYSSSLSVFNGYAPNGTWSLYVIDDAVGDMGSIAGGWSLSISVVPASPPSISSIANQSTAMNASVGPLDFTVSDAITPPGNLLVSGSSSNPTLLPNGNILFGGSGANRTVTLVPATGQTGTATVTLSVTNTAQLGTATSFTLNVTNASGVMTFANSGAITIPSQGAATPYPSTIAASGLSGNITKVSATLYGFSHTWPHDVGVLLVCPTGQSTLLMADEGAGNPASNVTLTFDDSASSSLTSAQITSGTYKPSSANSNDPFPTNAPAGPYTAALSTFNGLAPNGTWSLYVVDDASGDQGSISGGWSLTIYTTGAVAALRLGSHPAAPGSGPAIAGTANSTIFSPAPALIDTARLLPDGRVRLRVEATPGAAYVIQATTNWSDWLNIATITPGNSVFDYIDDQAAAHPQRFYRIKNLLTATASR